MTDVKFYLGVVLAFFCLLCAGCGGPEYKVRVIDVPSQPKLRGTQKPYEVNGQRYHPILSAANFREEGIASWYGEDFHGRKTSNGEIYDMHAMTAAHKILPMNVYLRVTNLRNGRSTVVRVNDRGPFVKGRIIDLSYSAAKQLDVVGPGTAPVTIEALGYSSEQGAAGAAGPFRQPLSYELGPFTLQVGAFIVQDNALRLAQTMKDQYGQSSVVEGWVKGQKFYRVRVGLYKSLDDAETAMNKMAISGYPNCFVVAKD
ncbi:MAG: septal ring lytic transglycosylase RlpA family protein [Deltaproteobacteria bacterium]|jgi:rare lipoprotein A|nr:septal ring lytic transglycosylase RlpA family protein [Deltaproteobacteria bacterium]MBW2519323.1 septal ring lytic transglycosylase RlpA family protein [Deltaproteobacteria bacterium]